MKYLILTDRESATNFLVPLTSIVRIVQVKTDNPRVEHCNVVLINGQVVAVNDSLLEIERLLEQ